LDQHEALRRRAVEASDLVGADDKMAAAVVEGGSRLGIVPPDFAWRNPGYGLLQRCQ
jgi:hypothetical protein